MALKVIVACLVLCVLQIQCSAKKSVELASAGAQSVPPEVQQQVQTKKFTLIGTTKTLRKQYKTLIVKLNNDLEMARNNLTLKLENVTTAAEQASLGSAQATQNGCLSSLNVASNDISLKIDELNINSVNASISLKSISKNIGLLNKQIGSYKKIGSSCKPQPVPNAALPENVDLCVTNQLETIDQATGGMVNGIGTQIQGIEANVAELIENKTTEISQLIQQASDDFDVCNN